MIDLKANSSVSLPDRASSGEWVYELFCQGLRAGWIVDGDGAAIIELANQRVIQLSQSQPDFVSIATANSAEFIANLMAGWRWELPIFLGSPQWGRTEWQQVEELTAQVDRNQHRCQIMIPTGGSSGRIKFSVHTWETLSASVQGFCEFYGVAAVDSVCVLPLYHVSGLMQLFRSLLTGGKLLVTSFHQLCEAPISGDLSNYFISLVPTQLHKLLDLHLLWLAQFQIVLLGGAPPSRELLDRARCAQIPLALTYGMTETGSQIASLKPSEFLAGNNSCGRVLPHAQIDLLSVDIAGVGSILISCSSLMVGYFPHLDAPQYFEPDDLGTIDDRGYLTILGRSSDKIISGGENVYPIEVVDTIMATGLVRDVWVVGVPDRYWGQLVTAVYVPGDVEVSVEILKCSIAGKISKYKIPKSWIQVVEIPRNSLGKVLVQELEKLISSQHLIDI